jgi:hypothetical protein
MGTQLGQLQFWRQGRRWEHSIKEMLTLRMKIGCVNERWIELA